MTTPLNLRHNLYRAPTAIADPGDGGTITIDKDGGICSVVTAAAETRVLRQPTKAGIVGTVCLDTDGGDLTLTVTGGYNADGDTSITLADAGDFVTFLSIKVAASYYWRVLGQEGTNVAVEDLTVDQLTATAATITTLTTETIAVAAESAEHGAGAIGTAAAPATYRYTQSGEIITEIKIDLTGLASVATADDIIGLAAGGAAIIGRNVVATNGIIHKIELICLETPAGGDNDINLVSGSAADNAYDDAVTDAAVEINGGDQVAGMVSTQDAPAVTADYYFYLTAGAGDVAAAYTAGMFIVRLHGHALLT